MYTIADYGDMIADQGRLQAYTRALRCTVNPGSVVVDVGTGTGIWALLACRFGARKVYAVEPDDIIVTAQRAAVKNGFADRIEFIQGLSLDLELPEKADLVVFSIHGVLPAFQQSIRSILDARDRFLKSGGRLVPFRESIWAALVSSAPLYAAVTTPWAAPVEGLDLSVFRRQAVNTWTRQPVPAGSLVSEPGRCTLLEYERLRDTSIKGAASWEVNAQRVAHGLCLWFDSELAPGILLSNSPKAPNTNAYGQAYFPWPEAVQLEAGDRVSLELRADFVGSDYIWTWRTRVRTETGTEKATFDQSSFYSIPLATETLRKRAHTFKPRLSRQGQIDLLILERMSSGVPLGDIATELWQRFPGRFKTWNAALNHTAELSVRYSD